MFVGSTKNPVQKPSLPAPDLNKKNFTEAGDDAINFDKMLFDSNKEQQAVLEKEKNAKGGDFIIGETKDEKEFRETMEKVTGKKQDKLKNKLDRDDYLTLLVTQLKYQDPSKPMEHYEMASQMAQFNTVEQLVGVNKALTDMKKLQAEGNADKLSQYIGKYIEVKGNNIHLDKDGKTTQARFDLPVAASNVAIEIKDQQMKTIRVIHKEFTDVGSQQIIWDGLDNKGEKALPGRYIFDINAVTKEGKPIVSKNSYIAKVDGVGNVTSGGSLEIAGGSVNPSDIIAVRSQEEWTIAKSLSNDKADNQQKIMQEIPVPQEIFNSEKDPANLSKI